MGKRRKSRELAVQVLYQLDMNAADVDEALRLFFKTYPHQDDILAFTATLVKGTLEHQGQIDSLIKKTAKNWSFDRLTPVDRSILREAVFEILFCPDIPYKVTLNEAIEMGKKYGSEKSGSFINGVLDNVLEQGPALHAKKKD